jgi:hypothetical protein
LIERLRLDLAGSYEVSGTKEASLGRLRKSCHNDNVEFMNEFEFVTGTMLFPRTRLHDTRKNVSLLSGKYERLFILASGAPAA